MDGMPSKEAWLQKVKVEMRPLGEHAQNGGCQGVHKISEQIERSVDMAQYSTMQEKSKSPLQVLHLDKGILLDSWHKRLAYFLIHSSARCLPALVIYGGTAGLLVCALCQYRWGVLLSLTLYSFYMLHMSLVFFVFSAVGLVKVYMAVGENWHEKYCQLREELEQEQEERWHLTDTEGEPYLSWHDVIHVVMVPNYQTPLPVLRQTLDALAQFSLARTNLGVVLAFEAREAGSADKAEALREEYISHFHFVVPTYHPADLPDHLPGKSSNECWAFQQLCRFLEGELGISRHDPRVVITVIDDDSEMHEEYFEALTYEFLAAEESERYLTTWQPPICHFKNYLRQPLLVRISSLFATLHELACLANPIDCHVPFSSYSISLVLASAVGGWDPEYLAEDWHMFAKCSLKTGGRVRCRPIFLPLLNYTPEEETYCGTLISRWSQARRHALGVSELIYVLSASFLALLEQATPARAAAFLWRLSPLIAKFAGVHFVNGMSAVWNVMAQVVIHFYMWRSWCQVSDLYETNGTCRMALPSQGDADAQIFMNSWLVYWQQRATALGAVVSIFSGGFGAVYFHLVKDRVEGDVDAYWRYSRVLVMWFFVEVEVLYCGLASSFIYGAAPLWIACICVIQTVRFPHLVAGMIGRSQDAAEV